MDESRREKKNVDVSVKMAKQITLLPYNYRRNQTKYFLRMTTKRSGKNSFYTESTSSFIAIFIFRLRNNLPAMDTAITVMEQIGSLQFLQICSSGVSNVRLVMGEQEAQNNIH